MKNSWRWGKLAGRLAIVVFQFAASAIIAAEPTHTVDLGDGVKLELVLIPAGTYQQGSPAGEKNRGDDETQREVKISQPFYLGKSPVTRGQFARFVAATGFKTDSESGPSGGFGLENGTLVQKPAYNWRNPGFPQTDDHPVVVITWDDAQAFAKWLSGKTKENFQLPSEAEWEYAIRAGTTTAFYCGDVDDAADRIAWHKGTAGDGTRPVGQKEANPWGLVDMAGNVWEWCSDWYGPYSGGPVTDPVETRSNLSDKPRRVLRGGSFLKDPKNARSAARFRNTPGSRNADTGFRVMFRPRPAAITGATAPAKQTTVPVEAPLDVPQSPVPPTTVPAQVAPPSGPPPVMPKDLRSYPPPSAPVPMARSWLSIGLLCPCLMVVVGGAVIVVLLIIWRGQKRSTPEDYPVGVQPDVPPAGGRRTGGQSRRAPRIVNDGFWLEDPIYSPGTIVRYSYLIGHTPNSGEFTIGPGHQGHFVYTGGTPANIQILEVLPGAGVVPGTQPYDTIQSVGGPIITGMSSPPPVPRAPHTPPPPRAGGFPSAY